MKEEKGEILIVDGTRENIHILDIILSGNGYRVSCADNAELAFEMMLPYIPDCIILDLNLPVVNGLMLCAMLKAETELRDIPVVFIIDADETESMINAFKAGCADCLVKPFKKEEVMVRIRNQVTLHRMKRRLEEIANERTIELTHTNALLLNTVDEYKKILKDLQDNETLLFTIAFNIPNSYLAIIEKDYTIGFASGLEFKKSGLDPWKLVGLPIEKVFKKKTPMVKTYFAEAFEGKESSFELLLNNQYLCYKTVPLINSMGEVFRILTVAENITDRKESENRIKESLREKDTLLREIHHRVKNNMQLVSSLLNIQEGYSRFPKIINIFRTLQSRILSMALVHEKLYHYKQFSKINFREYIKELIVEIQKTFEGDESTGRVEINLNLDNEYLSIERAIPCGLILSELVMNSFKHAFKNSDKCQIDILFQKNIDIFTLSVKDNGGGLPEGFDIKKSDSMGMVLIRELANQLHGKIMINSSGGAEFQIAFGSDSGAIEERGKERIMTGRKGILIVEDERIISTMLRKIIEDLGYGIIGCVASGKDAIKYALENHPDLIIMDIVLEDEIDGVEAARIIKSEISVPVVFLTGNSDAVTIRSAWDIKPVNMLTKPVSRAHLVDVINSVLG